MLREYTKDWRVDFTAEKKKLKSCLASDVYDVLHIGATSVKELSTYGKIDILLRIKKKSDPLSAEEKLIMQGYKKIADGIYENEASRVYMISCSDEQAYEQHIAIQSYLQNNKEAREKYEALKKEYASCDYEAKKREFLDTLLPAALKSYKSAIKQSQSLSLGMCFGTSIGLCLGVALDNIPIGMCLGMSLGVSLGSLFGRPRDDDDTKK